MCPPLVGASLGPHYLTSDYRHWINNNATATTEAATYYCMRIINDIKELWGQGECVSVCHSRRYIKEGAKQTLNKPNCDSFNIWEHSMVSCYSWSHHYPMTWKISRYMDQSEKRGCSIALLNSWLICFALSFIYLLGFLCYNAWLLISSFYDTKNAHMKSSKWSSKRRFYVWKQSVISLGTIYISKLIDNHFQ